MSVSFKKYIKKRLFNNLILKEVGIEKKLLTAYLCIFNPLAKFDRFKLKFLKTSNTYEATL